MSPVNPGAGIRRPKDKEDLIQQLLDKGDGPFRFMWQVLLFAAALGWSRGREEELGGSNEPIEYGTFARSATVGAVIDALAVAKYPDDPMILADDRLDDRIRVFERYANGGLAEIRGELNSSRSATVMEVLVGLVQEASTPGDEEGDGLTDFFLRSLKRG